MAEYKYRALGWQDDDIASLNVIDKTAADNQVELQITKQGEGGKISGPAIKGTDGITIDKAADSEKIEISGSGCVQKDTTRANVVYGHTYDLAPQMFYVSQNNGNSNWLAKYDTDGESGAKEPVGKGRLSSREPIQPYQLANKKYVDDNYYKKTKVTDISACCLTPAPDTSYGVKEIIKNVEWYGNNFSGNIVSLSDFNQKYPGSTDKYVGDIKPVGTGTVIVPEPTRNYHAANKKYVDDAVAAGTGTVDGTSIVKDADGKIQLNQEYIDYLDNQLYQPPAISVFTMLDAAGTALPTSNELGTTLSAVAFNHQETNIKNIQGDNVALYINNAAAATTSTAKKDVATKVTLTTAQSITSSTKFTLKGTNTKGATFSKDYQVNFYRYAYTATTTATTAPTSGATQQAAVSTFASNGNTFNYTKGGYIYFYTDNTGKKVQTNVLGQWADVDTTDMGKVTLTQNNGATHEYTCYRIGPFIETGSAKYRV